MSDQTTPNFESPVEADIVRLAEEVAKHRDLPETVNLQDREVVRRALETFLEREKSSTGPAVASPAPSPAPTAPADQKKSASPLPAYAQNVPAETKLEIEYFIDMALHKGLMHAYAEAAKSSPFVLDTFRDALSGALYAELQKRGIVK